MMAAPMLDDLWLRLQSYPFASAIRTGSWQFPALEIIHILSLSVVVGSILVLDLRLLGVRDRLASWGGLSREVLPLIWTAFALTVLSGALLFSSRALVYAHNRPFEAKMLCLLLAGSNMAVFHAFIDRRGWNGVTPAPAARFAGLLSIGLWVAIVFLGRWTGFAT